MLFRLGLILVCFPTEAALAAPRTYAIDEASSTASAHVGKTGFASFAGHEHVVLAQHMQGEIVFDSQSFGACSVDLTVDARSLKVREEGEPEGDAPKVQERMRGKEQLDVNEHHAIHFRSTAVKGKQSGPAKADLLVEGDLSLHGLTKPYKALIAIELKGEVLVATGKLVIKLNDFGIEPTSAAGGMVKVENDVPVEFKISSRATGK
jgi:polyisoprenoid-binding protein YceI